MKHTAQTEQAARQATALLSEATQVAADYSSKAMARQLAYARGLAEQGKDFSWQKFLAAPDSVRVEKSVEDYLTFARESVEDFAQASERNLDIWQQAVEEAADNASTLFPPAGESYGRQWADGIKAANTAFKDSVRASCRIAADSISAPAANGKERKTSDKK